jgi:hypothetical protein
LRPREVGCDCDGERGARVAYGAGALASPAYGIQEGGELVTVGRAEPVDEVSVLGLAGPREERATTPDEAVAAAGVFVNPTLGFDRTASYADTLALHEDSVLYVAVAGDRIIAVDPLVFYPVRLAGRDTKLVCRHNTCVATDFQGQGLMFALAAAVSVYPVLETDAEALITYVDPANFRVTSWSWVPVWKPRVLRARLPCAALAAAPAGRGARAASPPDRRRLLRPVRRFSV